MARNSLPYQREAVRPVMEVEGLRSETWKVLECGMWKVKEVKEEI